MTRKLTLIALAVIGSLFIAGSALAASDTATASVDIVSALSVLQSQDMSFGDVVPPSSGSQDFVLSATGNMTPAGGDGQYIGNAQQAIFDVAGTQGMAVDVTAAVDADFANSNLTLAALTTGGTANSAIPAGGTGTVTVGGTLTVDTGAPAGNHTATISLEVLYQ